MKKLYTFFILSCLAFLNIIAQEQNRTQWFIGGGANSMLALNGSGNKHAGGKVSFGAWINNYNGFRVNLEATNIWMKNDFTAFSYGAGAEWMVNLFSLKPYDPERKFFLNAFIGIGYNHYTLDKDFNKHYRSINDINGNLSIQPICKLGATSSLFVEPGIRVNTKFYDFDQKDHVYLNVTLSAGIIFNL